VVSDMIMFIIVITIHLWTITVVTHTHACTLSWLLAYEQVRRDLLTLSRLLDPKRSGPESSPNAE
jgi:hypothetical protein